MLDIFITGGTQTDSLVRIFKTEKMAFDWGATHQSEHVVKVSQFNTLVTHTFTRSRHTRFVLVFSSFSTQSDSVTAGNTQWYEIKPLFSFFQNTFICSAFGSFTCIVHNGNQNRNVKSSLIEWAKRKELLRSVKIRQRQRNIKWNVDVSQFFSFFFN